MVRYKSRRPSGLRKTIGLCNSLAHRTTWLRSDLRGEAAFTDTSLGVFPEYSVFYYLVQYSGSIPNTRDSISWFGIMDQFLNHRSSANAWNSTVVQFLNTCNSIAWNSRADPFLILEVLPLGTVPLSEGRTLSFLYFGYCDRVQEHLARVFLELPDSYHVERRARTITRVDFHPLFPSFAAIRDVPRFHWQYRRNLRTPKSEAKRS